MPEYKKGNLTTAEKIFIKNNAGNLTIAQMSKKLNRSPTSIENFLENHTRTGRQTNQILETLRKSHEYSLLKDELNDRELKIFEKKYSEWVGQFQEDILPSEKNQIFNAIKLEIIMSKIMQHNKSIDSTIESVEEEIKKIKEDEEMDPKDKDKRIKELREFKRDIYSNYNANIRVNLEHQKVYNDALKDLNASRGQRVQKTDIKKNTFMELMKKVLDDSQRDRLGEEIELERLAAEAEANRLKQTTTYLDGSIAEPFISGRD